MAANAKAETQECGALGGPDCACRSVVTRAFAGMTRSGAPYDSALSVAVRIFHHHHPKLQTGVTELIEQWISPEILH
jgi:hypothetical protein